jgi:tetratricopeptide (TPR) repeat protein
MSDDDQQRTFNQQHQHVDSDPYNAGRDVHQQANATVQGNNYGQTIGANYGTVEQHTYTYAAPSHTTRYPGPPPRTRKRIPFWIHIVVALLKYLCALAFISMILLGVVAGSAWLLETSGGVSDGLISNNAYEPRIYLIGFVAGIAWGGLQWLSAWLNIINERLPAIADDPNAPRQIQSPDEVFTGREQEIQEILAYLTARKTQQAAVIIRGMAGVGKTQLAYAVVHEARRRRLYPDGDIEVTLAGTHQEVTLAGTHQPLPGAQALQQALHVLDPAAAHHMPGNSAGIYRDRLRNRQMLILADNAGDANHVRDLLPPAQSALVITTRNHFPLRNVKPHICELQTLPAPAARNLLLKICPRTLGYARTLAKLCGYLPLALRISADLLETDPARKVPDYLKQLETERLRYLQNPDNPNDPAASVEAALRLSYDALPAMAQTAFAQLGVFVGDFPFAAAMAVLHLSQEDAEDNLFLLHRRSLLEYNRATERYDLHDLVRAFALARLEEWGMQNAELRMTAPPFSTLHAPFSIETRLRHARYYQQVASYAQFELYLKGKPLDGLALFDRERRQIDAGWGWAMEAAGRRGGEEAIDTLLLDFANATVYVGDLRYDLRRERIPHLDAQRDAARRLGRRGAEGTALGNLGLAYFSLGDYPRAIDYHEQALVISREIGDRRGEGTALGNLGLAYRNLGEYQRAIAYYEPCIAVFREIGDIAGVARNSWNLGLLYEQQGDLARAVRLIEHAAAFMQQIGHAVYAQQYANGLARVRQKLADQSG